ncbi:hypothetical protein ES708_33235 [subsurface metagenome]
MSRYIIKRVLLLIPIALGVALVVFLIMHIAPGDPARIMLGDDATPELVIEFPRLPLIILESQTKY